MAEVDRDPGCGRDPFALAALPAPALINVLLDAAEDSAVSAHRGPTQAEHSAHLVVAEAVRLIRLGTREAIDEAALAAAEAVVSQRGRRLKEVDPDSFRRLSAVSVMLGMAATPSGHGAELTVLRTWRGKARDAVNLLLHSPDGRLVYNELLAFLSMDETSFSRLLVDLETAGLIERHIEASVATIHVGPTARTEHVLDLVVDRPAGSAVSDAAAMAARERVVRRHFEILLEQKRVPDYESGIFRDGHERFLRDLGRLREHAERLDDPVIESVVMSESLALVRVGISATLARGSVGVERFRRQVVWLVTFAGHRISDVSQYSPTHAWLPPLASEQHWGGSYGESTYVKTLGKASEFKGGTSESDLIARTFALATTSVVWTFASTPTWLISGHSDLHERSHGTRIRAACS